MSFPRQRSPGLWTFDSVVEDFEFEAFDENLSHALDGQDGGAYVLGADMSIGGGVAVDWTFDLPVNFYENVLFSDIVEFEGITSFLGVATFLNDVLMDDNLEVNGSTFLDGDMVRIGGASPFGADLVCNSVAGFYDLAIFNGDATFNQNATFNDSVLFSDIVEFEAITSFLGTVTFNNDVTINDPVTFGTGGYVKERLFTMTDTNVADRGPRNCDEVFVEQGTLSGSRTFTIDDTGAEDGAVILFSTQNTSYDVTVKKPGGTDLLLLTHTGGGPLAGLKVTRARAVRRGGLWIFTDHSVAPPP